MAERIRLPGSVVALLLGVLGALVMLSFSVGIATIVAQQILVAGAPVDWAVPTLATVLGVLASLGPVGFFNETADGVLGLGVETAALPWVIVATAPMALIARLVGRGASESRLAELAFAVGYGLAAGIGTGLLASWAVAVEPGLDLPVSPDLVAARSALIALVTVGLVRLPVRLERLAAFFRPTMLGGLALGVGMTAVWLVGLLITIGQVPTEIRQGVTTAGSLVGANLGAVSLYASLGVGTDLSVGSGLTGSVDPYTLSGVTGLPDAAIALIGTAIVFVLVVPAMSVAVRRNPATVPPIAPVLGVALGFAGAGAGVALLISGGLDLLILPVGDSQRTFAEMRLDVSAADAFTQLGARAVFAGLPIVLLGERRRQAVARAVPGIEPVTEGLRMGHEV